ncbi:DUF2336 domain-containing protein [Sphingobium sp. HBC34]|uniref:DUF2336 domain-containing protein n=1 Tax=Sphingobium cyanobacteriorum TaxID=3063954 RepID=A0ABT8ZGC9_9SPHN|nr:DUF2336 domain-containing protein [Sphingobium sp. HBC34]MDO7833592.1 DUF2336 domain-containing protein [Sphingobium sp. HBC34]
MSAHSSFTGTVMAGSWPMARVMAGASAVPVGHAIDLAFFFPDHGPNHDDMRADALISETRRHLGGCVAAIEMRLRLSLAHAPAVSVALDRCPAPLAWPSLRAQPTLLGPALLSHMQMRAGLALMLRQYGQADLEQANVTQPGVLPAADDPDLGDAVIALMLAEGRWLAVGGEDHPMRPDLPAEHYAELVWTVAACLALAVQRTADESADRLFAAFERSGWALLADHDEGASPVLLAEQLVRRMGDAADTPALLGAALDQRRFLLFAALAARRLRIDSAQLIDMLLLGPVAQVATLCRALGGSDADYRQLLLALRPVRPSLSDTLILAEADRYQGLTQAQADAQVGAWRTPAAFRAKFEHLRAVAGI